MTQHQKIEKKSQIILFSENFRFSKRKIQIKKKKKKETQESDEIIRNTFIIWQKNESLKTN
jgi:hypothetical protein